MLPDKIKSLRKQARLSQEQLAERLHVSRQAITKWETGAGTPDLENLRALSLLFQVSLDELLANPAQPGKPEFLFHSVTSYDIDCEKSYDITFSGARRVTLAGYVGEKIEVRLASDQIAELQSAFKVKIDDVKRRIDVDVRRFGPVTEAAAKESLDLLIRLPQAYVKRVELAGNTRLLVLRDLQAEGVEFSGKAERVELDAVRGWIELNSNQDIQIICGDMEGKLDVNQLSATSRLTLREGTGFLAQLRGIGNSIHYQRNGAAAEDFSLPEGQAQDCSLAIELNGMRSELAIDAVTALPQGDCE